MNREIEFRIWDGYEFRYDIDFIGLDEDYGITNWSDIVEQKHLKIQQYTGLKDKKGKKIYEGDIIKSPALPDEVYVIDDFDRFIYWKLEADLNLKENRPTVIGNIFENPEFIK